MALLNSSPGGSCQWELMQQSNRALLERYLLCSKQRLTIAMRLFIVTDGNDRLRDTSRTRDTGASSYPAIKLQRRGKRQHRKGKTLSFSIFLMTFSVCLIPFAVARPTSASSSSPDRLVNTIAIHFVHCN